MRNSYQGPASDVKNDQVLVLTSETDASRPEIRRHTRRNRFLRRYQRAIAPCPAELDVRVHLFAICDRHEAAHRAFDPVRAEYDVRCCGCAVLEVHCRAVGGLCQVCAALVKVRLGRVDVLHECIEECRAVDAYSDFLVRLVLRPRDISTIASNRKGEKGAHVTHNLVPWHARHILEPAAPIVEVRAVCVLVSSIGRPSGVRFPDACADVIIDTYRTEYPLCVAACILWVIVR